MRKLLLITALVISLFANAQLYDDPKDFEVTIDGVTYRSEKRWYVVDHSDKFDYFVYPIGADPDITDLTIPEHIIVPDELDTVDQTNHTYKVIAFDGSVFDNCTKIKNIKINISNSFYDFGGYVGASFKFYGNQFPPKTVETIDINVNLTRYGPPEYYLTIDNVLYGYDYDYLDLLGFDALNKSYLMYIPQAANIKSLSMGENVKAIADKAFYDTKVTELNIPYADIHICPDALLNSSIKKVIVQNGLKVSENSKYNAYEWCKNLEEDATIYAPSAAHEQIQQFWHGENLFTYPPTPKIMDAKASKGNLTFRLKIPSEVTIDSILIGDNRKSPKINNTPGANNTYSININPLLAGIGINVYYTSSFQEGPQHTSFYVSQDEIEKISFDNLTADYGKVSFTLNPPKDIESAIVDSIYVRNHHKNSYYNVEWIKSGNLSKKGNKYSFQTSPLCTGSYRLDNHIHFIYKGIQYKQAFVAEITHNEAPFNDSFTFASQNDDGKYVLEKNIIEVTLDPDFLAIESPEDYGYFVEIESYIATQLKLASNIIKLSALNKKSISVGPLLTGPCWLTPYVTINDKTHKGTRISFIVPDFRVKPKCKKCEPGRIELVADLSYMPVCDSIAFEWYINSYDYNKVTNDTTLIERSSLLNPFTANIRKLKASYKYSSLFGVFTNASTWEEGEYDKPSFTTPALKIETLPASSVSNTRAMISAKVNVSNHDNGFGFEWRKCDAPDLVPSDKHEAPVVDGVMSGLLSNLSPNTYYQYRPYYTEEGSATLYGDWIAFGTADQYVYFQPTVQTLPPSDISETTATVSGYSIDGSENITERGFEYSSDATDVQTVAAEGPYMTATLTSLKPGTTYTVKAYAKDSRTTTYGTEQQFTTLPSQQDVIEEVSVEIATPTYTVFTLQGRCLRRNASDLSGLRPGLYIINGKKHLIR